MFLKAGKCVVTGRVINSAGKPAKDVLVKISGTDKQAFTDISGRFKLRGLASNSIVTLEFFVAHTFRYLLTLKLFLRITKLDTITLPSTPVALTATSQEFVSINSESAEIPQLKKSNPQSAARTTSSTSALIDAGEGVLMLGNGNDPYDETLARWAHTSYKAVQMSPQVIISKYTSGLQLLHDYWCIWVGVQGNITDPDVMAMMLPGGILDEFVRLGGIFVVHGAHTNPTIAVAPGGFSFISDTSGANDDDYPVIADSGHDYITGEGYKGFALTDLDFQEWYITCFGYIQVPEAWFLPSSGINLGTHPMPGCYNPIILSPANNNQPELVEYCYGKGYCLIDMMTFDWYALGTGGLNMNDALMQLIKYIIFIRNNFNR